MNKIKKYDYYFIYMTKNLVNNKCYVGWHATNNLNDGYTGSGKLLRKSIKKYGVEKFVTGIIEFYNEEEILQKEIFWINEKSTLVPNGYNLTLGGDGSLGRIASEKTKMKMKNSQLGKKASKETKNKMSNTRKNKKIINYKSHQIDEKTKLKISIMKKGVKLSDEAKQKISLATKGIKKISEEQKIKISLRHKGSTHNLKEVMCPHCRLTGKGGNMTRYHFDNCKFILKDSNNI